MRVPTHPAHRNKLHARVEKTALSDGHEDRNQREDSTDDSECYRSLTVSREHEGDQRLAQAEDQDGLIGAILLMDVLLLTYSIFPESSQPL